MPVGERYTHDVQLVTFMWDQVEERGEVDSDAAVRAFHAFPFKKQQEEAQSIDGPTFPTISFRSQPDGAILSIWSLDPDEYEVYLEIGSSKVTAELSDTTVIDSIIQRFFNSERESLFRDLEATPGSITKIPFMEKVRAFFGSN